MCHRELPAVFAVLLCLLISVPLPARTWTDASGKFSVEAELIRVEGPTVVLGKLDGELLRVPLARLSEEDRDFIRTHEQRSAPDAGSQTAPALGEASKFKLDFGAAITAENGPCQGLQVSVPVPSHWPEQQVKIVAEEKAAAVTGVQYRKLPGGSQQMVIRIPRLASGETAEVKVTMEITRQAIKPPQDPGSLVIPRRLDREARQFLGNSPKIETEHPEIQQKAEELLRDSPGAWRQVEAIYDFVRAHVKYEQGQLRGALAALREGRGDCEERTSLFIALCRASRIPARLVWVPGHCYPEFYLTDAAGRGHWFPCESTGDRHFGSMPRQQVILQKGDAFKLPEYRAQQRYLVETVKGVAVAGGGRPTFRSLHDNITSSQVSTPQE